MHKINNTHTLHMKAISMNFSEVLSKIKFLQFVTLALFHSKAIRICIFHHKRLRLAHILLHLFRLHVGKTPLQCLGLPCLFLHRDPGSFAVRNRVGKDTRSCQLRLRLILRLCEDTPTALHAGVKQHLLLRRARDGCPDNRGGVLPGLRLRCLKGRNESGGNRAIIHDDWSLRASASVSPRLCVGLPVTWRAVVVGGAMMAVGSVVWPVA
ncbi:hypothetical protein ECC02_000751 [Trypanosoma cruzi]|uniref:Uncharacterized protein n=1 Tax=Trypanosoma cruzi TaxID=5693 RepID=A0A7J6YJA0_TRYCR|nr:hypothetical protein ECC02_000751 [Trypanosoma cruzi]